MSLQLNDIVARRNGRPFTKGQMTARVVALGPLDSVTTHDTPGVAMWREKDLIWVFAEASVREWLKTILSAYDDREKSCPGWGEQADAYLRGARETTALTIGMIYCAMTGDGWAVEDVVATLKLGDTDVTTDQRVDDVIDFIREAGGSL